MKYSIVLLVLFTIPLISMEAPPQSLQQKIAAAQLHNRTHCHLARLPREIQDHLAQYLEFNDRESDEEFANKKIVFNEFGNEYTVLNNYETAPKELRTRYAGTKKTLILNGTETPLDLEHCPPPHAEELLVEALKPYEPRKACTPFASVKIVYSRDKSKVLMAKNYDFSPDETGCYFFVYDRHKKEVLFSQFILDGRTCFNVPCAITNDGRFFSARRIHPDGYPRIVQINAPMNNTEYNLLPVIFNKQSTKFINEKDMQIYFLTEEQEHIQRSKKTLALYLHQKGICKPFDYRQESA